MHPNDPNSDCDPILCPSCGLWEPDPDCELCEGTGQIGADTAQQILDQDRAEARMNDLLSGYSD